MIDWSGQVNRRTAYTSSLLFCHKFIITSLRFSIHQYFFPKRKCSCVGLRLLYEWLCIFPKWQCPCVGLSHVCSMINAGAFSKMAVLIRLGLSYVCCTCTNGMMDNMCFSCMLLATGLLVFAICISVNYESSRADNLDSRDTSLKTKSGLGRKKSLKVVSFFLANLTKTNLIEYSQCCNKIHSSLSSYSY
jgi:hypothetical protein